jgi:integrase
MMARTVRNHSVGTRSSRRTLPVRREPYWTVISAGCALGYRRSVSGGTWIARYRDDVGKQHYHALGPADDAMDSDGNGLVLSYAEAQRKADTWFKLAARGFEADAPSGGPYTVSDALRDYLAAYERKGGKAVDRTRDVVDAHITPALGNMMVAKLTRRRIEAWYDALAAAPRRLRTKRGDKTKLAKAPDNPEDVRRRRSSANRIFTVLRAALNHAFNTRKVASDEAWRPVKPFREVDGARIRHLNDKQSQQLVKAAEGGTRQMIQAALLTGCRYGELAALAASDFNADAGTIHIRVSKSGKPRYVVLTDEGQTFFAAAVAGKARDDILFARLDGEAWGKSHQHRPFKAALEAAELGDMTFHELRHTYATRLLMKGAPLSVVAAQLGHSDTRMVEKHYGHLSASYVADTVRATFTDMGLTQEDAVPPSDDSAPEAAS